jgi:hypothetical protein
MRLLCFLILLLLASGLVNALKISPAAIAVDFVPEKEVSVRFRVMGSGMISFHAQGPLASLVTFDKGNLSLQNASEGYVYAKLQFPKEIARPGSHEVLIVAEEVLPGPSTDASTRISSLVELASKLVIRVPYPDEYLEADLFVSYENETSFFSFPVHNLGSLDLYGVSAVLQVFSPSGDLLAELNSSTVNLKKQQSGRLAAGWHGRIGEYKAVGHVFYSGKKITLTRNFEIGSLELVVREISFVPGDISSLAVEVYNPWNRPVFASARIIVVQDGKELAGFVTPTVKIGPLAEKTLVGYWESKNFASGAYGLRILVDYEARVTEKFYTVRLLQPEGKSFLFWVLAAVPVLVILAAVVYFVVKRVRLEPPRPRE